VVQGAGEVFDPALRGQRLLVQAGGGAVDSQVRLVRGRDCGTGGDGLVPRRVGQRPSGADREGACSGRCQHDDRQQAAGER
jgi:hypothetical protein